jgi:drug/metabolite transporter (DMT)-like permease
MVPPDSTPLLRRAALVTALLVAIACAAAIPLFGRPMGLGIALGALVGWVNLWLLARALRAMLRDPQQHRPTGQRTWILPGVLLLKWPFILLALAFILWYMPARPEGVALGALLALVGASIAALRGNSAPSSPTPTTHGTDAPDPSP